MKLKTILYILVGVFLITLTIFVFLLVNNTKTPTTGLSTGVSYEGMEKINDSCVKLVNGKVACLIKSNMTIIPGEVEIQNGNVTKGEH